MHSPSAERFPFPGELGRGSKEWELEPGPRMVGKDVKISQCALIPIYLTNLAQKTQLNWFDFQETSKEPGSTFLPFLQYLIMWIFLKNPFLSCIQDVAFFVASTSLFRRRRRGEEGEMQQRS